MNNNIVSRSAPLAAALLAFAGAVGMSAAQAATLSVLPSATTVSAGESVDVAVVVSGLGDGAAPSLGAYDLVLGYDGLLLGFDTGSFGDPDLGNQLDLSGLGSFQLLNDGMSGVRAVELSFDAEADLDALQADSFTLFTLTFVADGGAGTSALTLAVNDLADAAGGFLTATVVNGAVTVVPVPAAGLLLLTAVGALGGITRRRRAGTGGGHATC